MVGSKGLAINARRDLLISVWNINLDEIRYSPEYLFVRNGKATEIEWPRNYAYGAVEAINSYGQIVGRVLKPADNSVAACVWDRGKVTDVIKIGNLCGLNDINNRGQAVGNIGNIDSSRAFLYKNHQPIILPTPPGSQSAACAINDCGWTAGTVITEDGEWLAVVWLPNGVMLTMPSLGGTISGTTDINNRGEIVGESETAKGERRICLWQKGRVFDLERCLKTPLQITLVRAINDSGQIICYGRPSDGQDGYFLLQPVGGRRW